MQSNIPFRVIDTIDGGSFLEIRKGLQAVRAQRPDFTPERARLVQDPTGLIILLEEKDGNSAIRQGGTAPMSAEEALGLAANTVELKPPRALQGSNLPLMEAGAIEFARKLPIHLEQYSISVAEEGDQLVVMFTSRDRDPGVRGAGSKPGFEVAFDRRSRRLLRSNFVR